MSKTKKVALIYDATLRYDEKVMAGVAVYVQEVGNWSLYVEEYVLHEQKLPNLQTWLGDGILADFDDAKIAAAVGGLSIPVVGFGGGYGWYDPAKRIPYIATDNQAIARLAAEHLLDRGFRRFAYCGYPRTRINGWSAERGLAFKQHVAESGFSCAMYTGRHRTARRWAEMQRALSAWLESLDKPLGMMACNDKRARHVLEACRAIGMRVPEDVAVIGVDNDEMLCQLSSPPLSSVEQGCQRVGYRAAALLDRMMAGKSVRQLKYVTEPAGVVTRCSSDILAIEDADVADAVRFIRQHACDGIQVRDVVKAAGVSRSTLETRFNAVMGRTVHAEIRRVQIDEAKQLVATTSLPLKQVAVRAGFKSVQYMTALFRQHIAQTPAQYRRRQHG